MSKKFLSLVLSFAMLLGVFANVSAFSVADDVKDTELETTAAILGALNIMTGDADTGNFRPNDSIKRSEAARVAISELGLESVAAGSEGSSTFADVPLTHWGLGYINVAAAREIVVGDDGVNFRPDDPITVAEASVIFTKMLGYEPKADAAGGYPTGYMITAENIGLFKGVKQTNGNATRGTIAKMAENALEIKLMEQTGYGSNIQYEVGEKTILKDTLNTEKLYGQVTANSFTRLDGASSLKDGQVEIDGKIYNDVTGQAANLLGFRVMYLVRENKNSSRAGDVIAALEDVDSMNSLEIDGENIVSVSFTEEGNKIEYRKDKKSDSKAKTAQLASDVKFIYNGVAAKLDSKLIKPESGTITGVAQLIDVDRDDRYDILSVVHYENYVTDSVSEVSGKVYAKYNKGYLTLDRENSDVKFSLTKDGSDIELSDLKEWDVLSVAKSLDGSVLTIKVSSKSVEGTVTEISKDYIYIDGEKYKVANGFDESISIEDTGKFHLDNYGKIAAIDLAKRFASKYAFLHDAYETDLSGKKVTFELFTADGKLESVVGADKMTLNGESSKTAKEVLEKIKNEKGEIVPQLITYELNDKGALKAVDLANDLTDGKIDEKSFSLNVNAEGLEYKAQVSKLGKYNVSDSTLIFDIPSSSSSDFSVKKKDMLIDGSKYDVKMYDVTESMTATIMVITNSSGVISGETEIAVVDSISTVMNADKEKVDRLYAYIDGKKATVNAKSLDYFVKGEEKTPLQRGDIIRYSVNSAGEADRFELLLDINDKNTEFSKNLDDDTSIIYGKVEKKFSGSINVSVNGANTANYAVSGADVYSFDSSAEDNEILVSSPDDIQKYDEADGSRVFLKIYKDEVKEVVIVK